MDLEHERRLTEVEERAKSNTKRLDKVEQKQTELGDLVTSVKVLAEREKNVEDDVKEIKTTVNAIAEKPAKRWEHVVMTLIATILALVIGYVFAKIGIVG